MYQQAFVRPQLKEVKQVLQRSGVNPPANITVNFQHGVVLIAREPGDTISTIFLHNPDPNEGSVALYAGWKVGEVREGVPNDGFLPVPLKFLNSALEDPQIIMWIWRPTGVRVVLN